MMENYQAHPVPFKHLWVKDDKSVKNFPYSNTYDLI